MDIQKPERLSARQNEPFLALVRMLTKCEDDIEGERLKRAFYYQINRKFYDRLKKPAFKLIGWMPNWEAIMEEVFDDVFIIAFKELKTFKIGKSWDDVECQKVILTWMSKIANNLLLEIASGYWQEKQGREAYFRNNDYDLIGGGDQERKKPKQTYDKGKFDKFWNSLNPMSKEILLICVSENTIYNESRTFISNKEVEFLMSKNDTDSCDRPLEVKGIVDRGGFKEQNSDHLSEEALVHLEARYKVKRSAIRKAKQRALEGLRKCKL